MQVAMRPPAASVSQTTGAWEEPLPPRSSGDLPSQRPSTTPSAADESFETRSARSASTASRSTNRLSLTLPIAPPTAYPTRPAPAFSAVPSYPPTPIDTASSLPSPVDPSDIITAIAAQERRVLELREDLGRAESELTKLKRQWVTHEAHKKRPSIPQAESPRHGHARAGSQGDATPRRSLDMDKRRALLLGQPSTPVQSRRRVFQGGHARTLSLLSPIKTTADHFPVLEDGHDGVKAPSRDIEPPHVNRYSPVVPTQLSKRASWAPQSTQQGTGVKQIAEDFKAGLWTFMEDLRQATVGEEPITGHGSHLRGIDANSRSAAQRAPGGEGYGGDQDTIRAPAASRPRVSSMLAEAPTSASRAVDSATKQDGAGAAEAPSRHRRTASKKDTKSAKPFSWTPLPISSLDDSDWANWDSTPATTMTTATTTTTTTTKSPRWSGTTVNGDIIPAIPEKEDEGQGAASPDYHKPPACASARCDRPRPSCNNEPPPSPPFNKLEELLPPVLNRLAPSNLQRHASDFMNEWEKSLSPPPSAKFSKARAD